VRSLIISNVSASVTLQSAFYEPGINSLPGVYRLTGEYTFVCLLRLSLGAFNFYIFRFQMQLILLKAIG